MRKKLNLLAISALCVVLTGCDGLDATSTNPGKNSARNQADFAAATKEAQDIRSYPDQIESVQTDLKSAKNEVRSTPDAARQHIDKSISDLSKIKSGIKKDSAEAAAAVKKASEHARDAAKKADRYDQTKPGFFDSLNPFFYLGRAWADVKMAAKVAAGWLGVIVVAGIILQVLSLVSGPAAPICAGILSWVGNIIGWVLKITSSIFSHTVQAIWAVLDQKYGQH